jgi:hypothetical protein
VGYDRTRPIPWKPLLRWAAIITVVLNITYALFSREQYGLSLFLASLGGGIVYVALGALLAKFGWTPPTARPRQAAGEARAARQRPTKAGAAPETTRARPAPTRRTNAGNRRTPPKTRR